MRALFFFLSSVLASQAGWAYDPNRKLPANTVPYHLRGAGIKERLGAPIDLSLSFADESGESRPLRDYIARRPVLLTVVYYNCPSLCNFHLNGLFEAAAALKRPPFGLKAGEGYSFIVVSMDDRERPALAAAKKRAYLSRFKIGAPAAKANGGSAGGSVGGSAGGLGAGAVSFLTGGKREIQALTDSLGFSFRWDEEAGQFAHSPVAYTLSAKGEIVRYLYGVRFERQSLRLALAEANRGFSSEGGRLSAEKADPRAASAEAEAAEGLSLSAAELTAAGETAGDDSPASAAAAADSASFGPQNLTSEAAAGRAGGGRTLDSKRRGALPDGAAPGGSKGDRAGGGSSSLRAAEAKPLSVADRVLLFCYRFDPAKNRYTLAAYNIMRAGAGLTALLLLMFLLPFWLRQKKQMK